jgi:hypothetical protein
VKVNVVRDENGKVVATFENPVGAGASIRPVLVPGGSVEEVEAEETYKADINAFYEQHSR